jgi:hypothetical protein
MSLTHIGVKKRAQNQLRFAMNLSRHLSQEDDVTRTRMKDVKKEVCTQPRPCAKLVSKTQVRAVCCVLCAMCDV